MRPVTERIDYSFREGEGRPIVFIHGWLGSKDFWKLLMPYLETERPVLTYNQRCHSKSTEEDFTVKDMAEDLDELLEALDIVDPILVGHSMGGMTALKYATLYENFSGLVLLGTCADTPDPENRSVSYFLEQFEEIPRREWAEKIADNYIQGRNDKIRDMTVKELMKADKRPVKAGLEAMMSYDVRKDLEEVDTQALVIAGEKDGAITMEKSKNLADLLDCRLETVDTTHQMLPERPEEIAGLIDNFCTQLQ
ncbi:alpha/beta fold hydrolase [Candidatus Nanosalina sp. VS9-1]|uniref:alpha/beta fold hydrolase n=1 Tax=Candidatus Nanosalina sp. VS9-1 TaxID=3388566 RepID=UPI0039E1EB08